jgi:hypothetical protein
MDQIGASFSTYLISNSTFRDEYSKAGAGDRTKLVAEEYVTWAEDEKTGKKLIDAVTLTLDDTILTPVYDFKESLIENYGIEEPKEVITLEPQEVPVAPTLNFGG